VYEGELRKLRQAASRPPALLAPPPKASSAFAPDPSHVYMLLLKASAALLTEC
jgi:hypothetical protein